MLVQELELKENFDLIKKEVLDILEKFNYPNQLCLQSTQPNCVDYTQGTGRIDSDVRQFRYIKKDLYGSELEKLIINTSGYRARIMRMLPNYCYTVHTDSTKRIHVPIVTSDQAWMVWPYNNECHNLKTGKMYLTDTTKFHSFFNGSNEPRIHLVICV